MDGHGRSLAQSLEGIDAWFLSAVNDQVLGEVVDVFDAIHRFDHDIVEPAVELFDGALGRHWLVRERWTLLGIHRRADRPSHDERHRQTPSRPRAAAHTAGPA